MGSKNYCWNIGTTSFRTSKMNYKIEEQLQLINEFWNNNIDRTWNQVKTDDMIKKLNMTKDEKYPTQVLYYMFLKDKGFTSGSDPKRDKNARAKTSGLVDLGLLNEDRKITPIGRLIMNLINDDHKNYNETFNIAHDSYFYLLQFLKMQINQSDFQIKPFIALLYMLEKLEYLTYEEFTYLLPLCKTNADVIDMVKNIKLNRRGFDVDKIIETKIYDTQSYFEMHNLFIQTDPITEETFEKIGMSGKSKIYDRKYKPIFDVLKELVIDLKNESFDKRKAKYIELYDFCEDISSNAKKYWRDYLFFGYRKTNIDEEFDKIFRKLDISSVGSDIEYKTLFFLKMHTFKWKINLEDYADLNRRYFSLTDIIKFDDEKIELDLLPKYYFRNIIDDILNEEILESKKYTRVLHAIMPIEKISDKYNVNISSIIDEINADLKTDLTIDSIRSYLQDEKIKQFNKLIEEKFKDDDLIMLLELIRDRKDEAVCKYVTDNADVPTIFEYILGITWYKISNKEGNILDFMNLSLDANLLPKTHAGGGMADIVYQYEENVYPKHSLVIEATLSDPNVQRKMELESVPRHLAKNIILTNNDSDYAVFVASVPEESVVLSMRSNRFTYYPKGNGTYIKGFKIIPINIDILIRIISKKLKYQNIYKWFDEAFKSEVVDPEWFDNEILKKI